MNSFYTEKELIDLGVIRIGKDCCISRKASFYNPDTIAIGNHVRIDDFCILSGSICIDNYVHIAAYSALYGGREGIAIGDYSNISSRVCVYAVSDDYSGESMTNPMIPNKFKKLIQRRVVIEEHVIIGTGSTVLPGTVLAQGVAIGAMSLVKEQTNPWTIYAGIPIKPLKKRARDLLELEKRFEKETHE